LNASRTNKFGFLKKDLKGSKLSRYLLWIESGLKNRRQKAVHTYSAFPLYYHETMDHPSCKDAALIYKVRLSSRVLHLQ